MAQGLQRGLDTGGRVVSFAQPSAQLVDALGPDTLVFLSGQAPASSAGGPAVGGCAASTGGRGSARRQARQGQQGQAMPVPQPLLPQPLWCRLLASRADVETEVWPNGTVAALAARTRRFLVTRGKDGADEWRGHRMQHAPVFEVGGWSGAGCLCV